MSKKKTCILALLILLLFELVWGVFSTWKRIKTAYFQPLKSNNGMVNFLLLGINSSTEAEKDLTDTIIFISLSKENNKVVLLSIPRDLWIEGIKAKINSAYHYGGIDLAQKTVSEVLGQPINYYAILNFETFERIIDYVGGIEVDVKTTFNDYKFPIPGKEKDLCGGDQDLKCRYEHIYFEKGLQVMDGKTALKFVRSRNAEGEEGTDFARSFRQQQVLLAMKDKIVQSKLYENPDKLLGLLGLLQQEVITDIKTDVYGSLAILGYSLKKGGAEIKVAALNGNLLVHPNYHSSKQWVLVPKLGNWEEVQGFVEKLLE